MREIQQPFADDGLDEDGQPQPPSKTQRKNAMHSLQDIGKELVKLPASKLAKIVLPDDLSAFFSQMWITESSFSGSTGLVT